MLGVTYSKEISNHRLKIQSCRHDCFWKKEVEEIPPQRKTDYINNETLNFT